MSATWEITRTIQEDHSKDRHICRKKGDCLNNFYYDMRKYLKKYQFLILYFYKIHNSKPNDKKYHAENTL